MLAPHVGRRTPVAAQRLGLRKGTWTPEEDKLLRKCIEEYGVGKWHLVPQRAGLNRCRKSCRLRWLNHLSPGIKRGSFDNEEDDLIMRLHKLLGNRWSLIAGRIPGRTSNDIKNYWNSHLSKRIDNDNRKESASCDSKVIRPQPQTIPINWFWLEQRTDCTSKHQEIISDVLISPLPLEKHVAGLDDTIINEGLSQEVPRVESMMTGSHTMAFGDEELLLPDLQGCGNMDLHNDIWPNLDLFDLVML